MVLDYNIRFPFSFYLFCYYLLGNAWIRDTSFLFRQSMLWGGCNFFEIAYLCKVEWK